MVSKALSSLQFNSDKLQGFHSGQTTNTKVYGYSGPKKTALLAGKKITQLYSKINYHILQ